MSIEQLKALQIEPQHKRRRGGSFWVIVFGILAILSTAAFLTRPWEHESRRIMKGGPVSAGQPAPAPNGGSGTNTAAAAPHSPGGEDPAVLTVSGYIINAARIQISPRFLGVVQWIGVKKGDPVTKGEVLARLDGREYNAKLVQAQGVLAAAKVAVEKAELAYKRALALARSHITSQETEDDARLQLEDARASLQQAEGAHDQARTYVDWCVIRSPLDGVVVEKLVNPDELVLPQSFGGSGGPSTALLAVADPHNLQVEVDVDEADLSKITLNQKCLVSPEAYPDRTYQGYVAEIAPEANRAKGTLQIKVQIENPDRYLTPELSAKLQFIRNAKGNLGVTSG
jgi:HlyD family secretion protein